MLKVVKLVLEPFMCFSVLGTQRSVFCFYIGAMSPRYGRILPVNWKSSEACVMEFDYKLPGLSCCRLFQKAVHILTYCVRQLPSRGIW